MYSDPERDPRHHTLTVVFTARAHGHPKASNDAADVGLFSQPELPSPIAFDHAKIINDFFAAKEAGAEIK